MIMPSRTPDSYTTNDIYDLPDGKRAGISTRLSSEIHQYIQAHNGSCEVFTAPFAVFLCKDDKNYVEPDISIICDSGKIDDRGCNGAPDWIIEIVSPGSTRMDYFVKLFKYRTAGVREYWIVNPMKKTVQTYLFEGEEDSNQFSFEDTIPVGIYKDLQIRIDDLLL